MSVNAIASNFIEKGSPSAYEQADQQGGQHRISNRRIGEDHGSESLSGAFIETEILTVVKKI